jgi:HTH-type transcriptional regulator / antitoxin HigA
MTITINPKAYGELLAEYQPKVITNEVEHQKAISLAEKLSFQSDLTAEEDQLLELLITLIEKFESEQYPLQNLSTPLSRLSFLVESNNLREADLVKVFGSKEIVYEVVNGQREISQENARQLGEFFNCYPGIFLF